MFANRIHYTSVYSCFYVRRNTRARVNTVYVSSIYYTRCGHYKYSFSNVLPFWIFERKKLREGYAQTESTRGYTLVSGQIDISAFFPPHAQNGSRKERALLYAYRMVHVKIIRYLRS